MANQLLALIAGVSKQAVIAGDAVWIFLCLDVLPSVQGFFAVVAIEALTHVSLLNVSLCKTQIHTDKEEMSNICGIERVKRRESSLPADFAYNTY